MIRSLASLLFGCWTLLFVSVLAAQSDISALQYSANGQFVAAGANDGSIVLFERESGKILWSVAGGGEQILGLQFRKADRQLLAFERRDRIGCFDVTTGQVIKILLPDFRKFCRDRPTRLALAQLDEPGDVLALADEFFTTIYLVDIDRALAGENELVLGSDTISVDPDTHIFIWQREDEPRSPAVLGELSAGTTDGLTDLRFSSRQRTAIAASESHLLFVWQWDVSQSSGNIENIKRAIRKVWPRISGGWYPGLAIGAQGQFVTVGYTKKFGGLQLWDLAKAEMIHPVLDFHPPGSLHRAVFNHAGDVIITSDEIRNCVWQNQGGTLKRLGRRFYHGGFDSPSAISFSPDDKEFAVGVDGAVAIMDLKTMKLIRYLGPQRPHTSHDTTFEEKLE